MKFGKQFRSAIFSEWKVYAVDYKALKKTLKKNKDGSDDLSWNTTGNTTDLVFRRVLEENILKLHAFYEDEELWASRLLQSIERESTKLPLWVSDGDASCSSSSAAEFSENGTIHDQPETAHRTGGSIAKGNHKQLIIYTNVDEYMELWKNTFSFNRELDLLLDFLHWNKLAFFKILKKFDKRHGTSYQKKELADILQKFAGFADALQVMKKRISSLESIVQRYMPELPGSWETRSIFTGGCFDVFHRGHRNLLLFLKKLGKRVVVAIPRDDQFLERKGQLPIDDFETRKASVGPYVDEILEYNSGDDLRCQLDLTAYFWCCFCGAEHKESWENFWGPSMPVFSLPRTDNCSSTWIRKVYHGRH